jgi:hypothetical protein
MVRSVPVPRVSGALRRASGMSEVSVMALSGAVATPDVQVPPVGWSGRRRTWELQAEVLCSDTKEGFDSFDST